MRILLFDIDGTLIRTGGAGRKAMRAAFSDVCGSAESIAHVALDGKTDWMILREAFETMGAEFSRDVGDEILRHYLQHLDREIQASAGYQVLPGVLEILSTLSQRRDVLLGLGTGNVEAGARMKLARGGLDAFFRFGGFGSDAEIRAEVIEAGVLRGVHVAGLPRPECDVIIVGDTPRDVAAAASVGARSLAVATGRFGREELQAAGANAVVESLATSDALAFLTAPNTRSPARR